MPAHLPNERVLLDAALTAWPLLLVNGMLLILVGYFLRGHLDRRNRTNRMRERRGKVSVEG